MYGVLAGRINPCLVIDAGTMITTTGSSLDGKSFVGGTIQPGITTMFKSMGSFGSALPSIPFEAVYAKVEELENRGIGMGRLGRFAKNTEEAMIFGVLNTVAAGCREQIAGWVEVLIEDAIGKGEDMTGLAFNVVFTGGDGHLVSKLLATDPAFLPDGDCDDHANRAFMNNKPMEVRGAYHHHLKSEGHSGLSPLPLNMRAENIEIVGVSDLHRIRFVFNLDLVHAGIDGYVRSNS